MGLSLAVARYLQWLPLSLLTEHAMLASMAFQLVSVVAVLAARSQHKRANRRRIQGLDRIDPATGLINQPVFIERLDGMIARSERFKNQSAVLLIDIINTEQTQRDFGRKAADELPLRVATANSVRLPVTTPGQMVSCLKAASRQSDPRAARPIN